jgi:hypothetical protein
VAVRQRTNENPAPTWAPCRARAAADEVAAFAAEQQVVARAADQGLEKAAGPSARGELRGFSLSRASAFSLGLFSHSGCFFRSSMSRSTESVTLRAAPVMKCLDM